MSAQVPDSAYRRPTSRAAVVVGVLGALAGLAVTLALYVRQGGGGVSFGARGFTVVSDTAVQVELEVVRDPGRTVDCAVRARDRSGAQVGSQRVTVPPSPDRRVVLTSLLPTTRRAVTGEVTGCALRPEGAPPP